ncbi:MAG: hypothetical protein P1U77_27590, partial [Rubripirellula sp.]|nr:hypothetical protein [Rubripirellula sp.]
MKWFCLAMIGLVTGIPAGFAAEMAMGFRVGEVNQRSAIIWTRITRDAERNWDGFREPSKRQKKVDAYQPATVNVNDRQGAVPGAVGQVRVRLWPEADPDSQQTTTWVSVNEETDYSHQFHLKYLQPGTQYQITVEARDSSKVPVSATVSGRFGTPQPKSQWQDVTFGVVTGQSYWDLDHRDGYHIYPAMENQDLDFLVPTGDTVYLDSEAPRARTIPLARYHWQRMYSLPRHVHFHREVHGYWEVDDHDSWVNDGWPSKSAAWMNPLTFEEGFGVYREQVPMGDSTFRTIRWGKGLQIW